MKPEERKKIQKEIDDLRSGIIKKERQLSEDLAQSALRISDHAKVQYLTRVKGMDIDLECQEIITPQLLICYRTLGNGTYPVRQDGLRAVIINGVIVTIKT